MNDYLAYKTNRGYVFSVFFWKRKCYPWPEEKALNWPPISPSLLLSLALPLVTLGQRMILHRDLSPRNGSKSSAHLRDKFNAQRWRIETPRSSTSGCWVMEKWEKYGWIQGVARFSIYRSISKRAECFECQRSDHVFHEIGVVDLYSQMLTIHLKRGDYNATYYSCDDILLSARGSVGWYYEGSWNGDGESFRDLGIVHLLKRYVRQFSRPMKCLPYIQ